MFQEAVGRNDAAMKRTAAEALSEAFECYPYAIGKETAAGLWSADRARSCQLRTASSSG
jgi:hypothetical protein